MDAGKYLYVRRSVAHYVPHIVLVLDHLVDSRGYAVYWSLTNLTYYLECSDIPTSNRSQVVSRMAYCIYERLALFYRCAHVVYSMESRKGENNWEI